MTIKDINGKPYQLGKKIIQNATKDPNWESGTPRQDKFYRLVKQMIAKNPEDWCPDHTRGNLSNQTARGHRVWCEIIILASQTIKEKA